MDVVEKAESQDCGLESGKDVKIPFTETDPGIMEIFPL